MSPKVASQLNFLEKSILRVDRGKIQTSFAGFKMGKKHTGVSNVK